MKSLLSVLIRLSVLSIGLLFALGAIALLFSGLNGFLTGIFTLACTAAFTWAAWRYSNWLADPLCKGIPDPVLPPFTLSVKDVAFLVIALQGFYGMYSGLQTFCLVLATVSTQNMSFGGLEFAGAILYIVFGAILLMRPSFFVNLVMSYRNEAQE